MIRKLLVSAASLFTAVAAVVGLAAPASAAPVGSSVGSSITDALTPVVVLGARLNPPAQLCTPPAVLDRRLDAAAGYLRTRPLNPVIVTGGVTQPGCPSEAFMMSAGLRLRGVVNIVLTEDRANSTAANAANVRAMLPFNTGIVLVTSADHMGRAAGNFAAVGLNPVVRVAA